MVGAGAQSAGGAFAQENDPGALTTREQGLRVGVGQHQIHSYGGPLGQSVDQVAACATQSHDQDLCRLFGVVRGIEHDPTFLFQ